MGKKLPKLKPREVKTNIGALGFRWKRTDGSHETWERLPDAIIASRKTVTVDVGKPQFDDYLMKMMIRQSGFTKEEFCTGIMNPSRLAAAKIAVPKIPQTVPAKKTP